MYAKMAAVFIAISAGGPLTMYYLTPTSEELFSRFSPELQKSNLENRARRQADYEDFVGKLKEYSKSDKPIWQAAAEAQEKARAEMMEREEVERGEKERMKAGDEGGDEEGVML